MLRAPLCSAVIQVLHDSLGFTTPTTPSLGTTRANIRDATRPLPIGRARAYPPPIDGTTQISGPSHIPSEDPAHQVPARCEDAHRCNGSSTLAKSNADVLQTSELSNRGILFVLSRSRVRRSSSPSDSRSVIAILRDPASPWTRHSDDGPRPRMGFCFGSIVCGSPCDPVSWHCGPQLSHGAAEHYLRSDLKPGGQDWPGRPRSGHSPSWDSP
jgi:hypothetical protein